MPTINPATITFLAKPPPHCHIHVPFEHFQGCEVISSHLPVEQALGVSNKQVLVLASTGVCLVLCLLCRVSVGMVALSSCVSVSHHTYTHAHTISLAFSSPYHPINCFTCCILHNESGPQGQCAGKLFCSEKKVHHSCSVPVQCCEIIPGSCFTLPLGYLLHWMTPSCSVHWDFETSC